MKTLVQVMVGAAAVASLSGCAEAEPSGFSGSMAEVMCEQFVEERLKSPASAEFSDQVAKSLGGTRWEVTGTVDSQNGFGAMLRGSYACTLEGPGTVDDDTWTAESVTVD